MYKVLCSWKTYLCKNWYIHFKVEIRTYW